MSASASSSSSRSSESSASRSPSPSPVAVTKKSRKSTKEGNSGARGSTNAAGDPNAGPRNEGTAEDWPYIAPSGFSQAKTVTLANDTTFDWENVDGDDDLEIWVLRVPNKIRPKQLESLELSSIPLASKKSEKLAVLPTKHVNYDVWNVGDEDDEDAHAGSIPCGGHELKDLKCLLPRRDKAGRLYLASKEISRHIVLSAEPVVPSTTSSSTNYVPVTQNPARAAYPSSALKHAFRPLGAPPPKNAASLLLSTPAPEQGTIIPGVIEDTPMDVDTPEPAKAKKDKKARGHNLPNLLKKRKKQEEADASAGADLSVAVGDTETPPAKKARKSVAK